MAISKARFRKASMAAVRCSFGIAAIGSQKETETPEKALAGGDLKFSLDGKRLHGSWVLVRMKHDRLRGKRTNWLLIKHRDAYAQEGDGDAVLKEDRSVASRRTMAGIAAGKGRGPKPFMLGGKRAADPNAVWDSSQGLAADNRASKVVTIVQAKLARKKPRPKSVRHQII